MNIIKKRVVVSFFSVFFPVFAFADVGINFTGNLTIPQCTINNNADVVVPFKDIEIQTLTAANTGYQKQEILIPVKCPYSLGTPSITLSSSAVHNASQGAIQTSKYSEGLVVYVYKKDGATPVVIGTATDISDSVTGSGTDRTLTLNAGVGRTGALENLKPGQFTASATMQVIYK